MSFYTSKGDDGTTNLLGEGRVTVLAGQRSARIADEHLQQLTGDAWPHGGGVRARLPVGKLRLFLRRL